MRILICPFNWYGYPKHGGGEVYLNNLCKELLKLGHEIKGIANCTVPFSHDGIDFVPQLGMEQIWNTNNDLFEWCDVIFTQLIGAPYAYNKCHQHKKPMFFFAHNTYLSYPTTTKTRVIYNSYWMQSLNLFPDSKSTVLQPIIPYAEPMQGKSIALINCNENKGAKLFNELAEKLPYRFIGVLGAYGEQLISGSVMYYEHGEVPWDDIKLLLVPSEIESWSQVASEACMRGIPVICSPLPGLKENLSFAGIYIEKDVNLYQETINELMTNEKSYKFASDRCLERAKEYVNGAELFSNWMIENSK